MVNVPPATLTRPAKQRSRRTDQVGGGHAVTKDEDECRSPRDRSPASPVRWPEHPIHQLRPPALLPVASDPSAAKRGRPRRIPTRLGVPLRTRSGAPPDRPRRVARALVKCAPSRLTLASGRESARSERFFRERGLLATTATACRFAHVDAEGRRGSGRFARVGRDRRVPRRRHYCGPLTILENRHDPRVSGTRSLCELSTTTPSCGSRSRHRAAERGSRGRALPMMYGAAVIVSGDDAWKP